MIAWHDISFDNPHQNVYLDEFLLKQAQAGDLGMVLRFWEAAKPFIVLGRIGSVEDDINLKAVKEDNIIIVRRSSGGGTVVQGRGCLNYSLVLSKEVYPVLNDLRNSYQWISQKVINAIAGQGIAAKFCPISDLATLDDLKFSGNAQKRSKGYILHHGTILYDFDLALISKYLKMPKDMPEYRQGREHRSFVTNIPIYPDQFKKDLAFEFNISQASQLVINQEVLSVDKIPAMFFIN